MRKPRTKKPQEEIRKEFIELVNPIIKFISKEYHPHIKIIITSNSAELVEGNISYLINDFIEK